CRRRACAPAREQASRQRGDEACQPGRREAARRHRQVDRSPHDRGSEREARAQRRGLQACRLATHAGGREPAHRGGHSGKSRRGEQPCTATGHAQPVPIVGQPGGNGGQPEQTEQQPRGQRPGDAPYTSPPTMETAPYTATTTAAQDTWPTCLRVATM